MVYILNPQAESPTEIKRRQIEFTLAFFDILQAGVPIMQCSPNFNQVHPMMKQY
jgi:hypothetical protein